ncbi:MAG: ATPase [Acidocella sp. 20-57-95]|nr:MAG: ATPase [Acidocella sp. 20-57-95]OYV59835.1 MAG: ATPase [Acidocella sp. 21-58-7]HQT64776.1 MoxR family ATPase [Acidocella sp.]HQU04821.1 MoxR family ATPase [Acidocella sp.]
MESLKTIAGLQTQLSQAGYVAERNLAVTMLMMESIGRPLLIEGDPGTGKTEVAKALAKVRKTKLIRLQCYEGLDTYNALYEWNYQRQLLAIKRAEAAGPAGQLDDDELFSAKYLLKRPLLEALTQDLAPVLLIDEIDRADAAFEAFLLELLSDYQVSIPEMGTITAKSIPFVVLTSNGTRDLSDALRRRCLYHFLDYPSFEKELAIVQAKLPALSRKLAGQIVEFAQSLRRFDLKKKPGIAETLDWAASLLGMGITTLDEAGAEQIQDSLATLLKTREDVLAMDHTTISRLVAAAG